MLKLIRRLFGYCDEHRRYGRVCPQCLHESHVHRPSAQKGTEIRRNLKRRDP